MSNIVNLVGQQKGLLTILKRIRKNNRTYYFYSCKCGKTGWMRADAIKKATSCGCIRIEKLKNNNAPKMIKKHLEKNIVGGTNLAIIKEKSPRSDNTSGHKGISYDKDRNTWVAYITFKGIRYFLGRKINKSEAIELREKAEEKIFKPFLHKKKYKK